MTFGEILQHISLVLGILMTLCYGYQLLYLLLPLLPRTRHLPESTARHYGILIAARNEALVLPQLLESIRNQSYPGQITVFVVADNCTDATAQVAMEGGAICYIRHNAAQTGKGYALEFLLDKIRGSEYYGTLDAFVVFDADNVLMPDYIAQLDRVAAAGYDAFCGFRNSKNFGSSWVSMGHSLWFLHDSLHLNASRMDLGIPCIVGGTGFGFTKSLLERCGGWHFLTLTEDIEFSTWCLTHGVRTGYTARAELFDEQPVTLRQSWRQRTRWVQGGIQVSLRYRKPLLRGICKGGKGGYTCLEAATLSLWGYGFSTLCGLLGFVSAMLVGGWADVCNALLTGLACALGGCLLMGAMTLLLSWNRIRASTGQKLWSLVAFPLFMLTYIPIGLTAVFRKYHWPPIEHRTIVTQEELCSRESAEI